MIQLTSKRQDFRIQLTISPWFVFPRISLLLSLPPGLFLFGWRPWVPSKPLAALKLLPWACYHLRPCFFYSCYLARGLFWLSWGPRVLSQHQGTLYDCSPGLPRSSPLVFLLFASSLAVSPGSHGVSTIPPRACRDLRRWLFLLFASSLVVSPGSPGVPGCLASTWGLATIAPRVRRDLCC